MTEHRKAWQPQQDQALKALVKKYGIKRWDTISQQLGDKIRSSKRSAQQCRQRWANCLSPKISKQAWNKQQLKFVFDTHKAQGNKWTKICTELNKKFHKNRGDSAVKNQFNSALRRALRRICKILGRKRATESVNVIKPYVLSNLLKLSETQSEKQFRNVDELYEILFYFSDDDKFEELKEKATETYFRSKIQYLLDKVGLLQLQQQQTARKPRLGSILKNEGEEVDSQPLSDSSSDDIGQPQLKQVDHIKTNKSEVIELDVLKDSGGIMRDVETVLNNSEVGKCLVEESLYDGFFVQRSKTNMFADSANFDKNKPLPVNLVESKDGSGSIQDQTFLTLSQSIKNCNISS